MLRLISKSSYGGSGQITKLEQEFDLGESLGRGAYGETIKVTRKSDELKFAIKLIKFESDENDEVDRIWREAKLLSHLGHDNIVRYFNSWTETAQVPLSEYKKLESESENDFSISSILKKLSGRGYVGTSLSPEDGDDYDYNDSYDEYDYDDDSDDESDNDGDSEPEDNLINLRFLCIQMELCENKTLRTVIDNNLYLDDGKVSKYFKEICEGLSYIHKKNIVHRDLNPNNIFLTSNDVIKIGDFGVSKQITVESELENLKHNDIPYGSMTDYYGTNVYIAPEIKNNKTFNLKVDIFSLGVIFYEMSTPPMTVMEKSQIFSRNISDHLQTLVFPSNNSKKKFLLRGMLHAEHSQRPKCDDILKILNSEKFLDEIKDVMQQKIFVPHQHYKTFERDLKSNTITKINQRIFFLGEATKIFELHGGQHIPMPTFMPPLTHFPNSLTNMINTSGNFTSVTSSSKVQFCYYAASNSIKKMRRYSTGKVFEEGVLSPDESQECIFQVVTPEVDDFVTDAEIFYIVKQICDRVSLKDISIFINHGSIYSSILKLCKIDKRDALRFTDTLMNSVFSSKCELLYSLNLPIDMEFNEEVRNFLTKMMRPIEFQLCSNLIKLFMETKESETFTKININIIVTALKQLKSVIDNVQKFGVQTDNIYVLPLFTNIRHSSKGIMFKIFHRSQGIGIASGGRFESMIKRSSQFKKRKPLNISAVDVSFDIENILKLMDNSMLEKNKRLVDVLLIAKEKSMAIPIYRELLALELKCEIGTELLTYFENTNQIPKLTIQLRDYYVGCVSEMQKSGILMSLSQLRLYDGNLKKKEVGRILRERFRKENSGETYRLGRSSYVQTVTIPVTDL